MYLYNVQLNVLKVFHLFFAIFKNWHFSILINKSENMGNLNNLKVQKQRKFFQSKSGDKFEYDKVRIKAIAFKFYFSIPY